jgi:hypothetical protein
MAMARGQLHRAHVPTHRLPVGVGDGGSKGRRRAKSSWVFVWLGGARGYCTTDGHTGDGGGGAPALQAVPIARSKQENDV